MYMGNILGAQKKYMKLLVNSSFAENEFRRWWISPKSIFTEKISWRGGEDMRENFLRGKFFRRRWTKPKLFTCNSNCSIHSFDCFSNFESLGVDESGASQLNVTISRPSTPTLHIVSIFYSDIFHILKF